jgi:hypothetical protein
MYNPYDKVSIEETIPVDYEDFLDEIHKDDELNSKIETGSLCTKCGQIITDFELKINKGICPCCDSKLIIPCLIEEKDIPI